MKTMVLGKTGLTVTKPAFGALPIQRRTKEEGAAILRRAYEGGIRYFDTANAYTDSEEKIGLALSDVRKDIVISSDFLSDKPVFSGRIILTIQLFRLVHLAVAFLVEYVIFTFKRRAAKKAAASERKEEDGRQPTQ